MKRTLTTIIACMPFFTAACTASAASPARLAIPLDGKTFETHDMALSASGEHICIAGNDNDEMGASAPRLVLVDRARQASLWKKTIALPDGFATAYPVQCLVGNDRVYLLTNDGTSLSPTQTNSSTYLYVFDLRGTPLASTRLAVPGQNQYGHTMNATTDGVTVAGYTMDVDDKSEHYASFTLTLDALLHARGAPVVRKNGAYASPVGARLVGDSLYITGAFFPSTVEKDSLGKFMASRLKTAAGYVWSTPVIPVAEGDVHFAVADDGTSYALSVGTDTTTLALVTPDGKTHAPLTHHGAYCSAGAIARYEDGIAAILKPCKGKDNQLVTIALGTGKRTLVQAIPDEPLHVASRNDLWTVLARDRKGKVYLYSGTAGEL
jgi:hypothetical protein